MCLHFFSGLQSNSMPCSPPKMENNHQSSPILQDFSAGLVVFLVALPLCLGIALASGAPLISGLVAGVVGGIVVSLLSGSEVSVSGPAAGLAVIVLDSLHTLGSFQIFAVAVILSGAFQVAFCLLRLGFIADYIPMAVIQGMLSAIGLVIIFKQIPHTLGRDLDFLGSFSFVGFKNQTNTFFDIIDAVGSISVAAVMISILSLLILLYWDLLLEKICLPFKIPASLVAIVSGTMLNEAFGIFWPEFTLTAGSGHLVDLGGIEQGILGSLIFPDYLAVSNFTVWKIAIVIALVGSVESLLSVEAADKLDRHHRISNPNQELFAQGVGNITSGILGGLPVTSVVVRSTANIYAGSKGRYSAFFHGIFLLLAILLVPGWLSRIPLAALASVLLVVGYKLINLKLIFRMWSLGLYQFIPFAFTIIAIMFSDLLTGVALGVALGVFFVLRESHQDAFTLVNQDDHYMIRFNKEVSFLNKSELKEKLSKIPPNSYLIIDGTKSTKVEFDIKDVLRDFRKMAKFRNIRLEYRHIHF